MNNKEHYTVDESLADTQASNYAPNYGVFFVRLTT